MALERNSFLAAGFCFVSCVAVADLSSLLLGFFLCQRPGSGRALCAASSSCVIFTACRDELMIAIDGLFHVILPGVLCVSGPDRMADRITRPGAR